MRVPKADTCIYDVLDRHIMSSPFCLGMASTDYKPAPPKRKEFWPLPDQLPDLPVSKAQFASRRAKWVKLDIHRQTLSDPLETELAYDLIGQQVAGGSIDTTVETDFRKCWRKAFREEGDTSLVSLEEAHRDFKRRRKGIAWTKAKANTLRVRRFWEKHAKAEAAVAGLGDAAKQGAFVGVSSYAVEGDD